MISKCTTEFPILALLRSTRRSSNDAEAIGFNPLDWSVASSKDWNFQLALCGSDRHPQRDQPLSRRDGRPPSPARGRAGVKGLGVTNAALGHAPVADQKRSRTCQALPSKAEHGHGRLLVARLRRKVDQRPLTNRLHALQSRLGEKDLDEILPGTRHLAVRSARPENPVHGRRCRRSRPGWPPSRTTSAPPQAARQRRSRTPRRRAPSSSSAHDRQRPSIQPGSNRIICPRARANNVNERFTIGRPTRGPRPRPRSRAHG